MSLKAIPFPLRWNKGNGLYWFDTVRINFISEAYTPATLSQLIDSAGIHIGHTYLGFFGVKYDDCAFEPQGNGQFRLRDEFQDFLDAVSSQSRCGRIWNPTLKEFSGFHRRQADRLREARHEGGPRAGGVHFRRELQMVFGGA